MKSDWSIFKQDRGLTLVELIVVIVIIALVVFLTTATPDIPRRTALSVQDMSHLRQISIVMFEYAERNGGFFPLHPQDMIQNNKEPDSLLEICRGPYKENNILVDRSNINSIAVRFGGYIFLNLGLNHDEIEKPAELIIAYSAFVSEDQIARSVLFADGHVEKWDDEKLRAALPREVDVDALDRP